MKDKITSLRIYRTSHGKSVCETLTAADVLGRKTVPCLANLHILPGCHVLTRFPKFRDNFSSNLMAEVCPFKHDSGGWVQIYDSCQTCFGKMRALRALPSWPLRGALFSKKPASLFPIFLFSAQYQTELQKKSWFSLTALRFLVANFAS